MKSAVIRVSLLVVGGLLVTSCYDNNDYNFTPYSWDSGVVVADFDGDGTLDVAVAQTYVNGGSPNPGFVTIYLQTSPGTFAAPVQYPVCPNPWALASGDLTHNSHVVPPVAPGVDLVVTCPNTAPGVPDSGQISILLHDPSHPGAFLKAQTLNTGGSGDAVAIGDVTGNGLADIAVADASVSDAHAILFLNSTTSPGTFSAPVSLSLGVSRGSNDVTIHDMDGDGRGDIVMAVSDGVAILYDNGAGSFLSPVFVAAGINPQGVAVADVDGDGRPDIVVANAGYSFVGGFGGASVTVLRQVVAGSFSSASVAVPDGAVQPVIADLDHDGLLDIGVLSFDFLDIDGDGQSQVSILRQTAATPGSF
ncbi:MAG TPA: VCBS repeat-containing protein, partial [Vicinamibacterales bacterium]